MQGAYLRRIYLSVHLLSPILEGFTQMPHLPSAILEGFTQVPT